MLDFIGQFNNRELAITIWIITLAVWAVSSKKIRPSVVSLVKAFFAWKLTLGYVAMGMYISVVLIALRYMGVWRKTSPATILIWIICVAFMMLFKSDHANKHDFFKSKVKENLRIVVIMEFIVNFYTLNLWLELLFVPLMAVIGGMMAIAERDSQYDPVRKLLNGFMVLVGIFLTGYAFRMAVVDFKGFATIATLESFVLPILLTLAFLPFVYLVAIYTTYESLFIRLQFFIKDQSLLKYTKKRTLQVFHFRLVALDEWSKNIYKLNLVDRQSVDEALLNMSTASATQEAEVA